MIIPVIVMVKPAFQMTNVIELTCSMGWPVSLLLILHWGFPIAAHKFAERQGMRIEENPRIKEMHNCLS